MFSIHLAEDGCLEDFDNSADYSKEYQASQECMCDSEHMFNCPGNTDENELETLARSIQNEGIELDSTIDKIMDTMDTTAKDHKVVAKKYFQKRSKKSIVKRSIDEIKNNNKSVSQEKNQSIENFIFLFHSKFIFPTYSLNKRIHFW